MIFYILTALATSIIVGGPMGIFAAMMMTERDAAHDALGATLRLLRQTHRALKAYRDAVQASQVGQKNPVRILSSSDRESTEDTDRSAFAPAPPTSGEEQAS